jgi:hypothetical protein
VSFGSASHAKAVAPKPRSGEGGPPSQPSLTLASRRELRLGKPREGCRAEAAQRRRRTSIAAFAHACIPP